MMKKLGAVIIGLLLVLPLSPLAAEERTAAVYQMEPIVVTATRTEQNADEVSGSLTTVTGEEIESRGLSSLDEALRDVPGVDVVRLGGPGGQSSFFLRGGLSTQSLVLIDGIEANNPIGMGRGFDAAAFPLQDIERIEILRGPQSTLYGSDAMSGVVQIFTRRGAGPPTGAFSLDYGSYNTLTETAQVFGGDAKYHAYLSLANYSSEGFSSAGKRYGNKEKDGYAQTSLSGRLGYIISEGAEIGLVFHGNNDEAELDSHAGVGGDDPNYTLSARKRFTRLYFESKGLEGKWHQTLAAAYSDQRQRLNNAIDADHPLESEVGEYQGELWKTTWQNDLHVGKLHLISLGVEWEEERGDSRDVYTSEYGVSESVCPGKTEQTYSAFLQEDFRYAGFNAVAGARYDATENFGDNLSSRAAASYLISPTHTRLRGAWGTGFKAPSLFQRFSPYGYEDLKPEKSSSWELGGEERLFENKLSLSVTYFQAVYRNLIEYDLGSSHYGNISGAKSRGWELASRVEPLESLALQLAYTHTDARDRDTDEPLIRRSGDKTSAALTWNPVREVTLNVSLLQVGKREDKDFMSGERLTLNPYTKVDAALNWRIKQAWLVSFKAENLFDEKYEEAYGYGTPGSSFYVGVKYEFPLQAGDKL